jgi:DNA-binding transcriptional MocR family regulator
MNAAGLPWATRTKGLVGSVIDSSTSLLQRQTHDIVSFAMGSPAAEAVPSEAFSEIYSSVLASNGAGVFAYGATEGETALRDELLAWKLPPSARLPNGCSLRAEECRAWTLQASSLLTRAIL